MNCGIIQPLISKDYIQPQLQRIIPITILFFTLFFYVFGKSYPVTDSFVGLFVVSLSAAFFIAAAIDYLYSDQLVNSDFESRKAKNKNNLTEKEKIIERRVSELNLRGQKIDSVLDKIKQNDTLQLQDVRQKLLSAREIIIGQMARYELQSNKIKLARLQNSVSPFVGGLYRLNEPETENGLSAIEHTKYEVEKMRQNLTNDYARDFPKAFEFEKKSFLEQIGETEDSCAKLREALLSRQATRALEGISPMDLPPSDETAHYVETFNIETTLTDFSESFEELEREYKRLKSENEFTNNFLNE